MHAPQSDRNLSALIHALRSELALGPAVRLALVFGSAAKGTMHGSSDLDVGVLPSDPSMTLGDELGLQARLTRAVGREVDLVRLDRAPTLLRWEIARAHLPVLADPSAELPRFIARAALDHADMADALEDARVRALRRLRFSRALGAGRGDPENGS